MRIRSTTPPGTDPVATTAGSEPAATTAGSEPAAAPPGTDPAATTAGSAPAATTAGSEPAATTAGSAPAAAPPEGDLAVAQVAASLEVLAVNTYGAALEAAGAGSLGEVPEAVAEFITTAQAHHQAALDAWNGVLTGNGMEAVAAPPADLEATVNEQFGAVTDVVGAAQLALMLEDIAAATYLSAIGTLESEAAIALAGSIQPIDRQHAAVLRFVLGEYPVPEIFATTDLAYGGEAAPASSEAPASSDAPETTAGAAAAGAMAVGIVDFAFEPATLEVPAGSTVTWTNNDTFDHTVVADDASFQSETMKPGDTFSFEFPAAGEFPYICGIHPQMVASITVTG